MDPKLQLLGLLALPCSILRSTTQNIPKPARAWVSEFFLDQSKSCWHDTKSSIRCKCEHKPFSTFCIDCIWSSPCHWHLGSQAWSTHSILLKYKGNLEYILRENYMLESIQDFLIKLDMKPCMHLVEISIFFTKSCHCQTYQNYVQSRQKLGTILGNKVS